MWIIWAGQTTDTKGELCVSWPAVRQVALAPGAATDVLIGFDTVQRGGSNFLRGVDVSVFVMSPGLRPRAFSFVCRWVLWVPFCCCSGSDAKRTAQQRDVAKNWCVRNVPKRAVPLAASLDVSVRCRWLDALSPVVEGTADVAYQSSILLAPEGRMLQSPLQGGARSSWACPLTSQQLPCLVPSRGAGERTFLFTKGPR